MYKTIDNSGTTGAQWQEGLVLPGEVRESCREGKQHLSCNLKEKQVFTSRDWASSGDIQEQEKSMRKVRGVLGTDSPVWLESKVCEWG